MITITRRRADNFTIIPNDVLSDPNLTWKAKGILSYLLGKPQGWKVQVNDLAKRSAGGEKAVHSAIRELRALGYVNRWAERDAAKRIVEWHYDVADAPVFFNEKDAVNMRKKLQRGFLLVANAPLNKKEYSKTHAPDTSCPSHDLTEEITKKYASMPGACIAPTLTSSLKLLNPEEVRRAYSKIHQKVFGCAPADHWSDWQSASVKLNALSNKTKLSQFEVLEALMLWHQTKEATGSGRPFFASAVFGNGRWAKTCLAKIINLCRTKVAHIDGDAVRLVLRG